MTIQCHCKKVGLCFQVQCKNLYNGFSKCDDMNVPRTNVPPAAPALALAPPAVVDVYGGGDDDGGGGASCVSVALAGRSPPPPIFCNFVQ